MTDLINVYESIACMAIAGQPKYEDMIVRIRLDGIETNQILEFNGDDLSWIWLNDWYEGQKDVQYIGSICVSDVNVAQEVHKEYETVSG